VTSHGQEYQHRFGCPGNIMSVIADGGPATTLTAQLISTPDRRVRVFISSTLGELTEERQAVRDAIAGLRQTPIMFETGARHHSARDLYRAYLSQSDVFVGIYWQKYGWVAPQERISGLEDEYLLSGDRPKLIYVKDADSREPRLAELLARVRADDGAVYKHFRTVDELADLVADDLAVLLTERFTAVAAPASARLRPPRLPVPPTAIIGRDSELKHVVGLLSEPGVRLLTLAGPGGIGKTRLALEVAAAITTERADLDGVWFVDLTPTTDPAQMLGAVAAVLGIRQEGTSPLIDVMADRLTGQRILLVLDNFEQVMGAAPDLSALLSACPGLTVLVTSRGALRLRGEREISLGPLPTPAAGEPSSVEVVCHSPAVQLFVARGHQVREEFTLSAGNAEAVAGICRRLDGVPLALELAAAQLRLLSPQGLLRRLAERLDRSLDLGSGLVDLPGRQQTLRATIDWSHSLLVPADQALLARLSVFTSAWTLEAAEAVGSTGEAPDVLNTLSSLVEQSLVLTRQHSGGVEPEFTMFEAVRAYARERLEERGEYEVTMTRLAGFLRGFTAKAGAGLQENGNRVWSERVDGYLGDLRRVMTHAIAADDAETVIAISAPLFTYWWSHGQLAEMRDLAEQAAALPSAATLTPHTAALLLWGRGMLHITSGRTVEAQPLLEQLLDAASALGDIRLRAHALAGLGVCRAATDVGDARRLLAEAVAAFRGQHDHWGLTFALSAGGLPAVRDGDPATATAMHTEALSIATGIDNAFMRAQMLDQLAVDTLASGDIPGARQWLAASAGIHASLLDQEGSAYCLSGLAAIALAIGQSGPAAQLLGAASHARSVAGVAIWPAMQPLSDALAAAVAVALPEIQLAESTAAGMRMRLPAALSYGLDVTAEQPV
jgi:predicted ATPase